MTPLVILLLFLVGMLLIAVEAFVIPGFGVPGLAGAAIVFYAAISAWTQLNPIWGVLLGGVALFATLGLVVWIPRTRVGRRLTLHESISSTTTYDADATRAGVVVGQRGITSTALKPSGYAMFGDSRVEVRSDGEWISQDTEIVVTRFRDGRVFVEAPQEGQAEAAETES